MPPRKVVSDENNRFRATWGLARDQGISRKVMAEALDIDRGRLNDLILGRRRPTLGEASALSGRRPATLIRYRTAGGQFHGTYAAQGVSFERIVASGELIFMLDETNAEMKYEEMEAIIEMTARRPSRPTVRIRSLYRNTRRGLRS